MRSVSDAWRRTARSRLRFELAGLAFACQHGFRPEDYARHLWGSGAVRWMGKPDPAAAEYLAREARAFKELYPGVRYVIQEDGDDEAGLVFVEGCLAGWGEDRWATVRSLGLIQGQVCAYCREAFSVWAGQLGLRAFIGPLEDGSCRLKVVSR